MCDGTVIFMAQELTGLWKTIDEQYQLLGKELESGELKTIFARLNMFRQILKEIQYLQKQSQKE